MKKRKLQIQIGYSKKTEDGFIDIYVKNIHHGEWFDNKVFKALDSNGDEDLEQAWRRKCHDLNRLYPHLNHWVNTRYITDN